MDILIYVVLAVFALLGVVLTLFGIPGVWLVFAGLLGYSVYTGFTIITPGALILLFVFSILSSLFDHVATILGAKKFGSSKWGIVGAILGGFFGLIFGGFIGMFLGPLLGATLFEVVIAKKETNAALKSGMGALIGMMISLILKFSVIISMIVWGIKTIWLGA